MWAHGGVEVNLQAFLTSVLHEGGHCHASAGSSPWNEQPVHPEKQNVWALIKTRKNLLPLARIEA